MTALVEAVLAGSRRALARLLTEIENEREGVDQALAALFPHTGQAWIIGVTGAPGTGKSSLVNALAKAYRAQDKTVAIIAVDPTSPFTGGAILGDRIRMRDLSGDAGVFIRSMATRGSLGGLARATRDAIRALDAAGFDMILVETVGAGQSEVEIVRTAQTTIVVEAPGLGDDVQAIKAGILEIADILVVNKADRPGAINTVRSLKGMLEMGHPAARGQLIAHHGRVVEVDYPESPGEGAPMWMPPVIQTVAPENTGIQELADAIARHRSFMADAGMMEILERQRVTVELYDRLESALIDRVLKAFSDDYVRDVVMSIQTRQMDPQRAVQHILADYDAVIRRR